MTKKQMLCNHNSFGFGKNGEEFWSYCIKCKLRKYKDSLCHICGKHHLLRGSIKVKKGLLSSTFCR